MKIVGKLKFQHAKGACANVAEEEIYLCFNTNVTSDARKCRKASSPLSEFEETRHSTAKHKNTRIAASESKLSFKHFALLKTF